MAAAPGTLRIATFNLENLDLAVTAGASLDQRIAVLRPQIDALAADVLCLQEVNGQTPPDGGPRRLIALDRLLEGTAYAGFHRAASTSIHPEHGARDRHNLVILSRWPLRRVREIRHERVPPALYRPVTAAPPVDTPQPLEWERPILAAQVDLPGGRPLHLFDLHLRAPLAAAIPGQKVRGTWQSVPGWAEGFFVAAVKRIGQAMAARLEVDRILDDEPEALICVAGDCNAEEREMPLRTLRAAPDDTEVPGFAWRALESLDQRVPAARRYSLLHGGHRLMLDHLLASRRLAEAATRVEIDNAGLADEVAVHGSDAAYAPSLHAPLYADFALGG
jgi:endonuclease/exonuclease/phosphatase family metal-dependent hydrolase